jgi:hypothetical protein
MARGMALWLAYLVSACSPTTAHKVITAADLADPLRTRISASLSAPMREGVKTEETPSSVRREAVVDEAAIKRLTASEVCLDLVMRTPISMDAPLGSWRATVDARPVHLGGEMITVRDYPCSGEPPATVEDGLSQEVFAAKHLGEPRNLAFRVVERRASACFPRGAATKKRVKLVLTLPASDGKGDWGEAFEWLVDGR